MKSCLLAVALWVLPGVAWGQAQRPADDKPVVYEVTSIEIVAPPDDRSLPPADELLGATLAVTLKDGVYEPAAAGGGAARRVALRDIGQLEGHRFSAGAVRQVSQAIVAQLNARGLGGVSVAVDPKQFDEQGRDIRKKDDRSLRVVLKRLPITGVKSEAYGERVTAEGAKDDPLHRRIRDRSPVRGADAGGEGVLRTDLIDEYVRWLNRHPGRRVEAAVGGGLDPDSLTVNYLVQENRPWLIYAQASNTGTAQTSEWRERFGFIHNQLTGNDDILQIDYSTAGFESAHAFSGSYEAPVFDLERLRWRVSGTYSEFVASDIGFFNAQFTGKTWTAGGDVSWNFFQRGDLFVDAVAGITHERVEIENSVGGIATRGAEGFLLPHAGVRAQRINEVSSFFGSLLLSGNWAEGGDTDEGSASNLGRADVDASWTTLNWDLVYAMYLEPVLAGDVNAAQTLAHEVAVSFRGQQVLGDDRVIPQAEETMGGVYTVRGYPEASSVGDNGMVWSAEYRFHVPQIFEPRAEPGQLFGQPFRWAPQTVRGRADWDVVLKAFVDYGRVTNHRDQPGEQDEDLLGAGVGVDFVFKRNLQVRVDWAAALKDTQAASEGSSRFHIVATIFY